MCVNLLRGCYDEVSEAVLPSCHRGVGESRGWSRKQGVLGERVSTDIRGKRAKRREGRYRGRAHALAPCIPRGPLPSWWHDYRAKPLPLSAGGLSKVTRATFSPKWYRKELQLSAHG